MVQNPVPDRTTAPDTLPAPFADWFARRGWQPHPHQLRPARPGPGSRDAADRADRRRQDAGGVPAEPDRARRRPAAGPAHALRLAAEGAGRRHPAQPRRAGRRNGAGDPRRGSHRRHRRGAAGAPADRSAAHPADHAGIAGADAVLRGGAADLRRGSPRDPRRDPRAGGIETRRPADALPRAPADGWRRALRRVGLSATVEDPPALAAYLGDGARVLLADPGPEPDISILETEDPPPWAGAERALRGAAR